MGRRPRADEPANIVVSVRLTAAEAEALDARRARRGYSRPEFLRVSALPPPQPTAGAGHPYVGLGKRCARCGDPAGSHS